MDEEGLREMELEVEQIFSNTILSLFINNINFKLESFSTQIEQRKIRKRQMGDLLRWHNLACGRGFHFFLAESKPWSWSWSWSWSSFFFAKS